MMPELGKYAFAVLSSYGATLGFLGLLIGLTVWQGRRIKQQLSALEARGEGGRNG